ncbi:DUF421 domain-containing protein [Methylophaga pinxianii]|uniref:DUF421 domain-containing protein n=1 Tax=Methylophaga pinxianii TaxID=2881052 RepID=UPI001CF5EDF4|nr:YetF domain-containing protein [Methylophaga pinxianii]MCB2426331.1 DUF421 domain-containing protein [Methylophaga pinxianii]UPH46828.1 DUF421 domain-containing protein [Methylophaga pinxianii]
MSQLFFDNWETLFRTLIIGLLAYISLVLLLRISGRRTLSKMNAFDLVVTVALGSTLATILLNRDVALAEGTLAFALLIGIQFLVTWTSVRVPWVRKIITGEPALLVYEGELIPTAMKHARVTEAEIHSAVRSAGKQTFEHVKAVVLETDGSFSVVQQENSQARSSLRGIVVPGKEKSARSEVD